MSADRPTHDDDDGPLRRGLRRLRRALLGSSTPPRGPAFAGSSTPVRGVVPDDAHDADIVRARVLLAALIADADADADNVDVDAVVEERRASAVATLVRDLPDESPAFRGVVAAELLRALERREARAGAHAPWAVVAPLVAAEIVDRCTWESAWRLLERSDAGASVAALVLARLPGPTGPLGPGRLHALATATSPAHRAVAIAAITHDARSVAADPATTANLGEVDAADVRAALAATLDRADVRAFNALSLALLLDATHDDVRACALRLLQRARAADAVDVADLLARCARHRCADVRAALRPLAAEQRDRPALLLLARAAIFDPAATDDELVSALDGVDDACDDTPSPGSSNRDVVDVVDVLDVLVAAAWRAPGPVRQRAQRIAARRLRPTGDVVVDGLLGLLPAGRS